MKKFLLVALLVGALAVTLSGQNYFRTGTAPLTNPVFSPVVVSTITTAGVVTYGAADFTGGLVLRDPNGAGRSDVSPTAALLLAAVPGAVINTGVPFCIRNTADAAETITMTAGAAATLSGTMTIAQSNTKCFVAVFTAIGTPAYTLYSLGTYVH